MVMVGMCLRSCRCFPSGRFRATAPQAPQITQTPVAPFQESAYLTETLDLDQQFADFIEAAKVFPRLIIHPLSAPGVCVAKRVFLRIKL